MAVAAARIRDTEVCPAGLGEADVAARIRRGDVNTTQTRTSRSVREILRANLLTRFNALLGGLLVVMLVLGPLQDALFGLVLIANLTIGVIQELRAKYSLDRLAVLHASRVSVLRSGARITIPVHEIVLDDLVVLQRGDQVPVDGVVLSSDALELDESLITGESRPIVKRTGSSLLSGSFVVAGTGLIQATAVGGNAYARKLAADARRFTLVSSELRDGTNRILRMITWIIPPVAVFLVYSQINVDLPLIDAVRGAVAGMVTLVPEGLVLLTSLALAVAVVRLARRRVLVQELAAVEGLARVDVLCIDKTGTLTDGEMTLERVELLGGVEPAEVNAALATLAAADRQPNASLRAIAARHAASEAWPFIGSVPFSSGRRWSAVTSAHHGTWYLGAPDAMFHGAGANPLLARTEELAKQGRRVLLLSKGEAPNRDVISDHPIPIALLLLGERIRPDAALTLRYFAEQGVAVKVISGDHPATVAAIGTRVGLRNPSLSVDGRDLPSDQVRLGDLAEGCSVFGRVTPQQKRILIAALQERGHVVAMTGDGVNDVLALKDADIGVAMGSGSSAARAVAQLVLLDNTFASLPSVIGEGRRVIANIERLANLFLTKTIYALLLAVAVGVAGFPFPFLPRHLTIVGSLSIGIPAFFLALAPNAQRAQPGFTGRVLRFAIPAGFVAAVATFSAYALVLDSRYASFAEARTMATVVLVGTGLWLLTVLARPLTLLRRALIMAMGTTFVLILSIPASEQFFALDLPPPIVTLAAVGIVALAGAMIELGWRLSRWGPRSRGPQALRHLSEGRH
jgi:cation-transporting P-type ATPase E